MSRMTAALVLLCCVATFLLGSHLYTLILICLICIGIVHALRSFTAICAQPQFHIPIDTAMKFGPVVLGAAGLASATYVIGIAFRDDPSNFGHILSVLSFVYAVAYGFCLLAGIVDCMAISACLKMLLARGNSPYGQVLSNPLVKAASLTALGFTMTTAGIAAVNNTIMADMAIATERAGLAPSSHGSTEAKDRLGEESSLYVATAMQTFTPGNVCKGLSGEDRIALLPDGRALVRPAITGHPSEWIKETRWPLAAVYLTRCQPADLG
jgi:hypothetical protein